MYRHSLRPHFSLSVLLAFGIISAAARPAFPHAPGPAAAAPPAAAVRETLPGGLRVIVEERPGSALTAIEIRVRVGSGAETPENNGAAHFIEHMLFRGSEGREAGAIDRAMETLGGEIAARTTRDDTRYAVVVGSEAWRDALGLLAEMLQTPTFAPGAVEREKAVIRAEMAAARSEPVRAGFTLLAAAAYAPGDPYRLPLMGSDAAVARLTSEDLRAFWKAHYRPENVTVVVVGQAKAGDVKRLAATLFPAATDPAPPPRPSVTVFSPLGRIERASLPPDQQPQRDLVTLLFAFRAPGAAEGDTLPVLDTLMPALVAGERFGRLAERLITKDRLALTVAADFLPGRTGSLILFTLTARPSDVARLEAALQAELRRLREDPLTEAEVTSAKAAARSRFRYDGETVAGRAARLALLDVLAPRLGDAAYLGKIDLVSGDDLRRAILRYLTPLSYAVAAVGPPPPPPEDPADTGEGARRP